MSKPKKSESIAAHIRKAKRNYEKWPHWMKAAAYFGVALKSTKSGEKA